MRVCIVFIAEPVLRSRAPPIPLSRALVGCEWSWVSRADLQFTIDRPALPLPRDPMLEG